MSGAASRPRHRHAPIEQGDWRRGALRCKGQGRPICPGRRRPRRDGEKGARVRTTDVTSTQFVGIRCRQLTAAGKMGDGSPPAEHARHVKYFSSGRKYQ